MPIDYLYPTPIYYSQVDDKENIDVEVEDAISKCDFSSNEEWHSPHKLSDVTFQENLLPDKNMNLLIAEINKHVGNYLNLLQFQESPNYRNAAEFAITSSWFSKFDRGEYAPLHSHGHHEIAGVYYHEVNDTQGEFYMECPTPQMVSSLLYNHLSYSTRINPRPGLLLLFPGYLCHGVYANNTDDARISLSFNVSFKDPNFK